MPYECETYKATSIRMLIDDLEFLKAIAKKNNCSFNYLINQIVKDYSQRGLLNELDLYNKK